MTSQAYAQRERIRTAASAGRLLVPTRSLPDTMDVPRPFAPALPDHVHALLRLCQDTAEAAAEASDRAGEAAAAVRAPSHLLTAARAAARAVHDASLSPQRPAAPEPAVTGHPREDGWRGPGRPAPARRQQPRPAAARSRHRPGQRAADHRSSQPHAPASIRPPARSPRSRALIITAGGLRRAPQKSHKSAFRAAPTRSPRTRRHSAAYPGTPAKIEAKTSPQQAQRR